MRTKSELLVCLISFALLLVSCITRSGSDGGGRVDKIDFTGKYRPQYHFTPEKGWMNDPNGLVYFAGEYHLFYQYYPDSTVWGPMHWGHALSRDLIHWKHLPVALFPDSLGYIFSGSAVVDKNNTSGFGSAGKVPLVAIYAIHDPIKERSGSKTFENQGLAFSLDNGLTWTKYSGNPVLRNPGVRDFRDPKVFWHEKTGRWIMILAVHDKIHIYSSPDLKEWTLESDFGEGIGAHGGVWECPDLFTLKESGTEKWVMLVSINPGGPNGGSATQYFTGSFDGHKFIPDDTIIKWIDYGPDNYAGVTWSDIPETDGRRIFLGWMSNWNYAPVVPATTWRSAMTLPRQLKLKNDGGNHILISEPVIEVEALRIASKSAGFQLDGSAKEEELLDDSFDMSKCELAFDFNFTGSFPDTLKIVIGNDKSEKLTIGVSFVSKTFFVNRKYSGNTNFSDSFARISTAPYQPGKALKVKIFLDTSSSEVFVDGGRLVMTSLFFPSKEFSRLQLFSKGGGSLSGSCKFHELNSIWQPGR